MTHPTTLAEANKLQLEVTFLMTAGLAEEHAATMTKHGREVVAVFQETLPGAATPLWLVCVKKQKRVVGPLGVQ